MRSSSVSAITMKMTTGMKMMMMTIMMIMTGTKGCQEHQAGPQHHGTSCVTHATATAVCSRRSSSGGSNSSSRWHVDVGGVVAGTC
jgi:hypothetical protein